MQNIAIISGGGSWGAYTVGRLYKEAKDYDVIVGCSTGSLMAPMVALNDYDRLKEAYTSITAKDIFSYNPMTKKGKVHILRVLWRIITLKMTIGDTKALKDTIKKFFTLEDFNRLKSSPKEVYITLTNLSSRINRTVYKRLKDCEYEQFVEYMWASASIPMMGSLVTMDGNIYCDGGTTEAVPMKFVYDNFNDYKIDCFIHRPPRTVGYYKQPRNIFALVVRLLDIQRAEINDNNIEMGKALMDPFAVNCYLLPEVPKHNYTIFDKNIMREWFNVGYNVGLQQ